MAITDRIRELEESPERSTGALPAIITSSTLVVADPTSRRVSGLLRELGVLFNHSRHNDWIGRQLGIILDAIREEVEESDDIFSGPMAQAWIVEFSRLMEWTATGDYSKLPENLLEVACRIDGIPMFEYKANNPANAGQIVKAPRIAPH